MGTYRNTDGFCTSKFNLGFHGKILNQVFRLTFLVIFITSFSAGAQTNTLSKSATNSAGAGASTNSAAASTMKEISSRPLPFRYKEKLGGEYYILGTVMDATDDKVLVIKVKKTGDIQELPWSLFDENDPTVQKYRPKSLSAQVQPAKPVTPQKPVEPVLPAIEVEQVKKPAPVVENVDVAHQMDWRFEAGMVFLFILIGAYSTGVIWLSKSVEKIGLSKPFWGSMAVVFNIFGVGAYAIARYMRMQQIKDELQGEMSSDSRSDSAKSVEAEEEIRSVQASSHEVGGFPMSAPVAPGPARAPLKLGGSSAAEEPKSIQILDENGAPMTVNTDKKASPIIETVKTLLARAVESRASDIHIEPTESDVTMRLRVDGAFQPKQSFTRETGLKIIQSLKTFANVDVAEHKKSQDGRFRVLYDGRAVDFRLATSVAIYGETIVIRILDRGSGIKSLEELGMLVHVLEQFEKAIAAPGGMILISGPTGSGKTSTVYAALSRFDPSENKIITVEDPVEYELKGATQIPVNPKAGITYEEGLKSVLRQDPDIILVGEMRSKEATEVAIRSALTGHLVFSTLHANSSVGTISRLRDMSIEPYLISSALVAAMSQRLVRILCPDCKESYVPSDEERETLGISPDEMIKIYRPKGCKACGGIGFKGRIGIFEILVLDQELKGMISSGTTEEKIFAYARSQGMTTMQDDVHTKVLEGYTTLQEASRIL